jgi:predicted nucleic acid-binding protein
VVYFVDPSVVIAIHSKDVFVLSEELFQLSGFSVTEVRLGRCNHVL